MIFKHVRMLRAFTMFIMLFNSILFIHAQPAWEYLTPIKETTELNDFSFLNKDTGFVTGSNTLMRTFDGGLTWKYFYNPEVPFVYGVHFFDLNTGIITGQAGDLYRTTNGGTSWTEINSGVSSALLDLTFVNATTGYIVGGNGTILKTTNSGTSWTKQTTNTTYALFGTYFLDQNNGFAVGNLGTLLRTVDGGVNWSSITTSFSSENFYGIYFTNSTTGFIVGSGGLILKTINGGTSWSQITSGTLNNFRRVYFKNATTGFITGDFGSLYKTTDGGSSWTNTSPINKHFYSIISTSGNVLLAGGGGIFLRSENEGAHWDTVYIGAAMTTINDIAFLNNNTGYVAGSDAENVKNAIMKTSDGGEKWITKFSNIATSQGLNSVYPISSSVVLSGGTGRLMQTSNGGTNWTSSTSGFTSSALSEIYFRNSNVGYMGTINPLTPHYIFKTTDGGVTWVAKNFVSTSQNLFFTDDNTGFSAGAGIYKTTDAGETWSPSFTGNGVNYSDVFFATASIGYAGSWNQFIKTTDGGATWTTQSATTVNDGIFFSDALNGYTVTPYGYVLKTTNGGTTWNNYAIGNAHMDFNTACFLSDGRVYAAGKNGDIYRSWYKCTFLSLLNTDIAGNTIVNQLNAAEVYSINQVNHVSYQWSISGGGILTANGNNVSVLWTSEGNHTLTLTATDVCGGQSVKTLPVLVDLAPAAPQNLTAVLSGGDVELNWTANTEPDFSVYFVYKSLTPDQNDAEAFALPSTNSYTHSPAPTQTTYYWVNATDWENNKSDFSNMATFLVSGTMEQSDANSISVYPNPCQDVLRINTGASGITSVSILNVVGIQVAEYAVDPSNDFSEFDVQSLKSGWYTLEIKRADGRKMYTGIVKE